MDRNFATQPKTLGTATDVTSSSTKWINKSSFAWGTIWIKGAITTLTFHGAPADNPDSNDRPDEEKLYPVQQEDGSGGYEACTMTVEQNKCYPLPVAIATIPFLQIVADAAGDVVIVWSS